MLEINWLESVYPLIWKSSLQISTSQNTCGMEFVFWHCFVLFILIFYWFCLSWFIQPSPGLCFDTVPALYNVSQTVHVYHDLTFRPVSLKSLGNNNVWYGNWNMLKKTSNAILTLVCLFGLQHFTILSHLFNH
jgi:hypothetical protein